VMSAITPLIDRLRSAGVRVRLDDRDERPGFKFNDWEMRGVPLRLEIGPKDIEKGSVVLARRDIDGKAGKQFVSQQGIVETVKTLLDDIQANMLQQATEFRDANIHDVEDYDGFKTIVENGGWTRGWWAGSDDDERQVKEDTGATLRCFPLEGQPGGEGKCFYSGKTASRVALFAKAY